MPDIPKAFDRRTLKPLIWSYTLLHTYRDVCPHQCYRRYIAKDLPFVETEPMRWGNEVHTAMEYRVGGGKPLPQKMQKWEPFALPFDGRGALTEMKLGVTREGKPCDFFAKNVWGRGKVDLSIINNTTAYINDWKTGGSKYEDPFELEVCATLLHARYPQLKTIKGQYSWLKEDRLGQLYDLSNTNATWQEIGDIVSLIEQDTIDNEFEKKRTPLCAWCNVFDCEKNTNPDRPASFQQ